MFLPSELATQTHNPLHTWGVLRSHHSSLFIVIPNKMVLFIYFALTFSFSFFSFCKCCLFVYLICVTISLCFYYSGAICTYFVIYVLKDISMWLWVVFGFFWVVHFSRCTIKFMPIPTPDNYTANPAKNIFFSHFPLLEFTTLDTTLVSLYVIWATKTHLRGLPRFCKSSNPLSYNYTTMLSNLWGWALCQLASKTH